jgi:ribosomal protein S18 acetylase RimI-like enzyme
LVGKLRGCLLNSKVKLTEGYSKKRGGSYIIISQPNELDINQIFDLFLECKEALMKQGIYQWDDVYPNKDVIQEDIRHQCMHAIKIDDEIAGVISFDENDCEEYKTVDWMNKNANFAVVHRLCVRPKYQGRGIALRLMQFVNEACKQRLFTTIRLDVYSGNQRAIEFYRRLGYQIRGEVFFPRRTLPFICMEKDVL